MASNKDKFTLYIHNNVLCIYEAYDDFYHREKFIKYLLKHNLVTRVLKSNIFFNLKVKEFVFEWDGEEIDIKFCNENTKIAIAPYDNDDLLELLAVIG